MANTGVPIVFGSAGVIDVLIQAATTVSTSGKVRVFARLLTVEGVGGDISADEVVRDQIG
mgnify:CR=1 FL=1